MPKLTIDIEARLAQFQDSLDTMGRNAGRATKQLEAAFGALRNTLSALGATAAVGFLAKMTLDVTKANAALLDLSAQTGASVEGLSRLQQIGKIGGQNFDDLAGQIGKMVKGLKGGDDEFQKAAEGLKFLGVSAKNADGSFRDTSAIIEDVAKALEKYRDDGNKTALVQDILGKGAERFIPYLKDIVQFGGENAKVTEKQARESKEFEENLNKLKSSSEAWRRELVNELTPALVDFSNKLLIAQKTGAGGLFSAAAASMVDSKDLEASIKKYKAELESLENPGFFGKLADNLFVIPGAKLGAAARQAAITLASSKLELAKELRQQQLAGLTKGLVQDPSGEFLPEPAKPSSKYVSPKDTTKEQAAELKRYISALQSLEKKYFDLTNEGERTLLMWETTKGSLRGLTGEHKKELLVMAEKIDAFKREADARKLIIDGVEAQVRAIEQSRAVVEDQAVGGKEAVDELRHQAALIGLSAREQEKLNAVRAIELDLRQRAAQLPKDADGNLMPGAGDALNQLREQAEAQKKIVLDVIDARQKAERDWVTGAKNAFNEYIDYATDAARQTHDLFSNAFHGMEDALVSFVKTGKLDFRSFADSIIEDLIRIQVRKSIVGPLAEVLGGLFRGGGEEPVQLGGPRASGGPVSGGKAYLVGEEGPELFIPGRSGGIVPNDALGGGIPSIAINVINPPGSPPTSGRASAPRMEAGRVTFDLTLSHLSTDAGARDQLRMLLAAPQH